MNVPELGRKNHVHLPEELARLRKEYTAGTEVELVEMNDPYRDMPPGLKGVIETIDDAGCAHIRWENGLCLAAIYGVDRFRRI